MKVAGLRWVPGLLGLVLVVSVGESADAGWREFFQRSKIEAKRVNSWPEPFQTADREAARAPFEVHKNAGWRLENTLVDAFFDEQQQLTHAGKLKVRHILTQVPAHRRSLYVLQGETPEITEQRVDAVQQSVANLIPDGPMPPVMVTAIMPRGGTGEYLYIVNSKYRQSIPAPVLPEAQGTTGGGEGM